jgi:membrane protease YdiL (CAAX protease family)
MTTTGNGNEALHANRTSAPAPGESSSNAARKLIAPWWHTASVLLILGFFAYRGAQPQERPSPLGGAVGSPATSFALQYLILIGAEILLAYWVFVGVHWRGGTLWDLVRGRWANWRDVVRDFAIALPFWVVWEATAIFCVRILYTEATPAGFYHVPAGAAEISAYFLLCVVVGFCEELVFRGYFLQQFQAMTGSSAAGVVLQAIVFGLVHSYKGWRQVVVITVLGVLYGLLVVWRRNLRTSMIAHAFSDMYEGFLKFLLPWHP